MTASANSVLTLRGDPFQRGSTHGLLARAKIRAGVEHYGRMWERNAERSRAELFDLAGRREAFVERDLAAERAIRDYDDRLLRWSRR